MKRSELEHLIRAAGAIAADDQIVVIGSQSVLGQFPDAPVALRMSMEADLYPRSHPERADMIDGAIGEGPDFHRQFGYYAQGVGADTAVLPPGWETRLIEVSNANTSGVRGLCLEAHDLAVSKYVAGREKDREFTRHLVRLGYVDRRILEDRIGTMGLDAPVEKLARGRIARDFQESGSASPP
jgi:hypothetical protein